MDLGIKDKLALVTGSSKGIGKAIAAHLAHEGTRLILVARNKNILRELTQELSSTKKRHVYYARDLMAIGEPVKLAKTIVHEVGVPDIIVHNIGGSLGVTSTLASLDDWKKVWQYNIGVAIDINSVFIPKLIKKKWGRIVMLSTLSTVTFNGYAPYVSAKMAVNGYVKTLGRDLAKDNVIVTAVAPGAISLEGRYFSKLEKENPKELKEYFHHHLPRGKLGTPEEIAPVVTFLCSEYASFMSGSIVGIDGGGI